MKKAEKVGYLSKSQPQLRSLKLKGCFELRPHSLVVEGSPAIEKWIEVGKALQQMEGSVQFWIGDWLNYGHKAYERGKYEKALEELDYDYGTLRNYAYVAGRVEMSRRRDNLSFGHHQEVAPLPPPEQEDWLDEAEKGSWSVSTLRRAIKESKPSDYPSWLKYTDIWYIPEPDGRFGSDYEGRIPGQIIQNLLYYYTREGDRIIDPMAGGGVTIDVCKAMARKYLAYDIEPKRKDIEKLDARVKWPTNNKADLVFIDPPYWKQREDVYKGVARAKNVNVFLNDMKKICEQAKSHLKPWGKIAILMAPLAIKTDYIDLPFEIVKSCEAIKLRLIRRIGVPVSSQQVGPQVQKDCKEKKIMVALLRDLLIFQKLEEKAK